MCLKRTQQRSGFVSLSAPPAGRDDFHMTYATNEILRIGRGAGFALEEVTPSRYARQAYDPKPPCTACSKLNYIFSIEIYIYVTKIMITSKTHSINTITYLFIKIILKTKGNWIFQSGATQRRPVGSCWWKCHSEQQLLNWWSSVHRYCCEGFGLKCVAHGRAVLRGGCCLCALRIQSFTAPQHRSRGETHCCSSAGVFIFITHTLIYHISFFHLIYIYKYVIGRWSVLSWLCVCVCVCVCVGVCVCARACASACVYSNVSQLLSGS